MFYPYLKIQIMMLPQTWLLPMRGLCSQRRFPRTHTKRGQVGRHHLSLRRREFSVLSCELLLMLVPNFTMISAPNPSTNWTGVNSYDNFWSKFNDSQYVSQFATTGLSKVGPPTSTDGLAPAGSQFPFTNTVAPSELFGPIRKYD